MSDKTTDELRKLSGWEGEFTLGYLLRKLPMIVWPFQLVMVSDGSWVANHSNFNAEADDPTDAVCYLLIELFKKGVLRK